MTRDHKAINILQLRESDREGIGNKARHLAHLLASNPLLFSIPDGLVLLPGFSLPQEEQSLLQALKVYGDGPFAVRSCGLEEDGAIESMAGKFHTELFVTQDNIPKAISLVRRSYGTSVDTSAILIQQMINPDYAGVLFTRSPENYGLASCEFGEGTADDLVSGKVEPERADYGRWTGNIYSENSALRPMLERLFLVGLIIEEKMREPQDIEWAYIKKTNQIFIIQSRGITSQLYNIDISTEQKCAAETAIATKQGKKGKVVYKNAAVREVVTNPTRITRSLMEQLYSPSGALGRALELLKLPTPKTKQPYVCSLFGQLYENCHVEKELFGFSFLRLRANRKLKRRLQKNPQELKNWLNDLLDSLPIIGEIPEDHKGDVQKLAELIKSTAKQFTEKIYPVAYVATLIAQLADEQEGQASLTSKMMRDLSRMHHTKETAEFLKTWGLRSINDYELSVPRFCEDPQTALEYAEGFSNFPWKEVEYTTTFTHLKEVAKDMAIQKLYPLRTQLLEFEKLLGMDTGQVFLLDLTDINDIASGKISASQVATICKKWKKVEELYATIQLGDEVELETIELLQIQNAKHKGLHGKMVSERIDFQGSAQLISDYNPQNLQQNSIIITKYLDPQLVALFPSAAGCLVDMGGTLSHAAIVAREMKFPILVLPGVTDTIKDGDQVKVSALGGVTISR